MTEQPKYKPVTLRNMLRAKRFEFYFSFSFTRNQALGLISAVVVAIIIWWTL